MKDLIKRIDERRADRLRTARVQLMTLLASSHECEDLDALAATAERLTAVLEMTPEAFHMLAEQVGAVLAALRIAAEGCDAVVILAGPPQMVEEKTPTGRTRLVDSRDQKALKGRVWAREAMAMPVLREANPLMLEAVRSVRHDLVERIEAGEAVEAGTRAMHAERIAKHNAEVYAAEARFRAEDAERMKHAAYSSPGFMPGERLFMRDGKPVTEVVDQAKVDQMSQRAPHDVQRLR